MEIDLVCGIPVDPAEAAEMDYEGKSYFFCSTDCLEEFRDDPEAYLTQQSAL